MIARISTTEAEFRNTHPGVKKMFAWIEETLAAMKAEFGHLVVDGVDVEGDPLEYVKKRHKEIKEIVVQYKQKKTPRQRKKPAKPPVPVSASITIKISNHNFSVERSQSGLDEMFRRIEETLQEFGVYFSHLLYDGQDVPDVEPRTYCEDNLDRINDIDVCFLTAEQLIQQVMQVMDDYIKNALPTLKVVADDLYGHPDDETWHHFDANIQGMASMLQLINSVVGMKEVSLQTDRFAELGSSIAIHLENLQNAAKLNDYTMMADIMHFELIPFLENLHTAVADVVKRCANVTH